MDLISLRTFNEIFSFKAPVRLLPCDHTSEDQMVELGRTNGTKQLVSFSLKLQLLPGPGQPTVLASKDEKVQGDGIKACQGENFTLPLFSNILVQREVDRVLEEIHEQNR